MSLFHLFQNSTERDSYDIHCNSVDAASSSIDVISATTVGATTVNATTVNATSIVSDDIKTDLVESSDGTSMVEYTATDRVSLGASTLNVDTDQNFVGIGLSSPGYPLSVAGDIQIAGSTNMLRPQRGAYTQLTSTTTAVPVVAQFGVILTQGFTLAAGASSTFDITNANLVSGALCFVGLKGYGGTIGAEGTPYVSSATPASGACTVTVSNIDAANALGHTMYIWYLIIP